MSYPRNAASPPVIAVGAIYLLADGTIQTTGASARVKTGTGAWGAAAGTLACDSTSGVWTYTPTQAETDAESFLVAVYKSASTSAQVTIATSASATAGYGGVDWSKVTAATSTVNLSGTTISTSQAVASVSGSVGSVTGAVGSVTGAVGSVTGNVGGNVVGSVGSISGVTFPSNFGSLLINASGHVSRVVLVDTTTTNSDMRGTDNAALANSWTATRAGYLDGVLLADNYNQRIVAITGSNHIAADVHEFQPDVLTSAATAASFVAEVQSGLATSAALAVVDGIVDQLKTRSGYTLSILAGAIANAQNAAEAYTITLDGTAYGVTYSGLDSSGNRTGATLTET